MQDGYIKAKLIVMLQVLADLKSVLKEDTGLDLNVSKTSVLPKDVTQQDTFDTTHNIINVRPAWTHLNWKVVLTSFCPEGFVGIDVPIDTDALYGTLWLKHVGRL
jgi:hypothetical protein